MFSRDDLQQLAEYQSPGSVLSLTLNVDPTQRGRDQYRLALRHLLHSVEGQAEADAAAIERFFEHEYDWSGRGLAIFSCQAEKFWKVYSLAMPIADSIFLGPRPHLTTLANLWDTYGRFVIGLFDQQGARFSFVQMGEVIDTDGVLGEEVRHTKSGVGATPTGRRRNSDAPTDRQEGGIVKRNLKESAGALVAFCDKHQPRYIVLSGNTDLLNEVRALLPQAYAGKVIGAFAADINEPDLTIRDRALKVLEDFEARRETELADAAITAAAKGSNGVVRIDETLSAAHEGRIQTLLVSEGFRAEGYRCRKCGYLTTQFIAQCPFCGDAFEKIPDAVNAAITQVLARKGRVEIVRGHKALSEAGIGALLRY
jgi:peptide subunit release factor 1 (eRF1)